MVIVNSLYSKPIKRVLDEVARIYGLLVCLGFFYACAYFAMDLFFFLFNALDEMVPILHDCLHNQYFFVFVGVAPFAIFTCPFSLYVLCRYGSGLSLLTPLAKYSFGVAFWLASLIGQPTGSIQEGLEIFRSSILNVYAFNVSFIIFFLYPVLGMYLILRPLSGAHRLF